MYICKAAFSEARALLNEWIARRCLLDEDGLDTPALDLSPVNIPSRLEIKKEWDHLIRCASKANDSQWELSNPLLKDDIRHSPYENKSRSADKASKNSRPKSTTLDRILMRQEEARARRLLQTQERDARLKEMEEEQKLRKRKHEEELLQQEMIRVRKELNAENERQAKLRQLTSSRERPVWSVEDHVQTEVDKYVPVDSIPPSSVGGSTPVYLETDLERPEARMVQSETKLLTKATIEQEEHRRLKETEFLEKLKTCSSQSSSKMNEPKPAHREQPLNTPKQCGPPMSYQTMSSCRPPEATVQRPSLSKTVLKQRERISAQNREIEELKAAKRYTELLLEASTHKLAGGLSQQQVRESIL
ncbi:hypothetical protein P879_00698 [Paragonimus westermani]|uniref:Uncharacterized protein n=1 Tax=Paragonimus westermani TaxID=34504 RepID=A0A8T0DVD5_9TREM|nr:hypothetical protein P879_00698 [Paragonimus westermani]